jgi:hypothetical protein
MAAKKKTKEAAEAKLAKQQAEAAGAGRAVEKDRTERKSAPADKGPGFETETPSALALAKVGNLDGEDVKPDGYEAASKHGERYQAEKKKHRWG